MSAYKSAVSTPVSGYQTRRGIPTKLVRVTTVIPTPKGPVVAGELVEAEYYSAHDVGFSLKKLAKKAAKGVKKAAKATGKVVKTTAKVATLPHRLAFKATKAVGKGAVKVTKKTGKVVLKGTKGAVKMVAKNPLKAAALAVAAPVLLPSYAAVKAGKAVAKVAKGKPRQAALPPMEEEAYAVAPPAEAEYSEAEAEYEPESYPGETYESEEAEEESPDMLESPSEEEAYEESEDSYEAEPSEEDEYMSDSEDAAIEGESNMAEWVGLDEIAGDDDGMDEIAGDEWVGAAPKKLKKRPPGPNAALVRSKGYDKSRRQPLGFNSTGTVAAGASATITVTPQTLYRGRKLVIGATVAAAFMIVDVKVGNVSQLAAAGEVSAEAFLPTTTGDDNITLDTCPPGMSISIVVRNASGSAAAFSGTLFGDSVS